MTMKAMPKGVVGDKNTRLASPYNASTDTTITVDDATVIPDATSTAPNYASVRMPNKSCLVTFSYTGKTGNTVTGVTVLEADYDMGLTATYPVGSKVYWSITNTLLSNIIDNILEGGGATWGNISGDIDDQDDLQDALDGKLDSNFGATEANKYLRINEDGSVSPAGGSTVSVSFADITGSPSDNPNLNTVLESKVSKDTSSVPCTYGVDDEGEPYINY